MNENSRISRGQWIALLCFGLLPVIAMGAGVYLLTTGVRIELRFTITYILIPVVSLGLLALCLISKCRLWVRDVEKGVFLMKSSKLVPVMLIL